MDAVTRMCVLWFDLFRDMSYTFVCLCLLLLDDKLYLLLFSMALVRVVVHALHTNGHAKQSYFYIGRSAM